MKAYAIKAAIRDPRGKTFTFPTVSDEAAEFLADYF